MSAPSVPATRPSPSVSAIWLGCAAAPTAKGSKLTLSPLIIATALVLRPVAATSPGASHAAAAQASGAVPVARVVEVAAARSNRSRA